MDAEPQKGKKERGVFSFDYLHNNVLAHIHKLPTDERDGPHVANVLLERTQAQFGQIDGFDELLAAISELGSERLSENVTTLIQRFLVQNFSLEEHEEMVRPPIFLEEDSEHTLRLNELCTVEIKGEMIDIHLNTKASLGAAQVQRLFLEAMKELATQLQENPRLVDIQEVHMLSWIIARHPKIAERFGFTINPDPDPSKKAEASQSKEAFIKRFTTS